MEFLCAQDDYPYQIKRLTVRLFYPSAGKPKASGTCFLYYLSVYVSLSKIALLFCGCKGTTIFRITKTFWQKNHFLYGKKYTS